MRYRTAIVGLGSLVAGSGLAAVTLLQTFPAAAESISVASSAPASTPTPSSITYCDPRPPEGTLVAATATSLTFSFTSFGHQCGDSGVTTVSVVTERGSYDTLAGRASAGGDSGTITVDGLTPDTSYYYIFSGGGSPFSNDWQGPVTTLSGPTTEPTGGACTATYRTASSWPSGFQGEVTVRAGASGLSGWTVTWALPGDQAISQLWGGTYITSGSSVTVRNATWNGALAADATTTVGFIGTGDPSVPTLACTSP